MQPEPPQAAETSTAVPPTPFDWRQLSKKDRQSFSLWVQDRMGRLHAKRRRSEEGQRLLGDYVAAEQRAKEEGRDPAEVWREIVAGREAAARAAKAATTAAAADAAGAAAEGSTAPTDAPTEAGTALLDVGTDGGGLAVCQSTPVEATNASARSALRAGAAPFAPLPRSALCVSAAAFVPKPLLSVGAAPAHAPLPTPAAAKALRGRACFCSAGCAQLSAAACLER